MLELCGSYAGSTLSTESNVCAQAAMDIFFITYADPARDAHRHLFALRTIDLLDLLDLGFEIRQILLHQVNIIWNIVYNPDCVENITPDLKDLRDL